MGRLFVDGERGIPAPVDKEGCEHGGSNGCFEGKVERIEPVQLRNSRAFDTVAAVNAEEGDSGKRNEDDDLDGE